MGNYSYTHTICMKEACRFWLRGNLQHVVFHFICKDRVVKSFSFQVFVSSFCKQTGYHHIALILAQMAAQSAVNTTYGGSSKSQGQSTSFLYIQAMSIRTIESISEYCTWSIQMCHLCQLYPGVTDRNCSDLRSCHFGINTFEKLLLRSTLSTLFSSRMEGQLCLDTF